MSCPIPPTEKARLQQQQLLQAQEMEKQRKAEEERRLQAEREQQQLRLKKQQQSQGAWSQVGGTSGGGLAPVGRGRGGVGGVAISPGSSGRPALSLLQIQEQQEAAEQVCLLLSVISKMGYLL